MNNQSGLRRSDKTKRQIAETRKARGIKPVNTFKKGHEPWNKGKVGVYTEAHNTHISESLSGNKSPCWRGGIAKRGYPTAWIATLRRSIRERDNYTCQICSKQQEDSAFDVHHIDYNKENCNPNNLITLCKNCHRRTNHKREYWVAYFSKVVEDA